MKAITRRTFMRLAAVHSIAGAVVGSVITSNAVGKEKSDESDVRRCCDVFHSVLEFPKGIWQREPIHTIRASEIKAETIAQSEYSVIDDLVEEMNRHDAENPGQKLRYFIHCNYSGLGMLNQTKQLTRGMYKPDIWRGYRHVLWFPLNLQGCMRGVSVGTTRIQKADIALVACSEKDCCGWDAHHHHPQLHWVTTRCFDVDYTELGKALMREC